jgi:hypothetical protein
MNVRSHKKDCCLGDNSVQDLESENRWLSRNSSLPLVSILILNYNGKKFLGDLLEHCIDSVLASDYGNFEVLFVDNGSTDDSVEFVKNKFGYDERLKMVENNGNLGFAEGNNLGLRYAKGKHIVFLNSDVIVNSSWLRELVKTAESNESIGVCGGKGMFMEQKGAVPELGISCDIFGFPIGRHNFLSPLFYVPGWALLIKRETLDRIGAFDAKYFMFVEDLDLCWRAHLAGYQVVVNPSSIAHHLGGGSIEAGAITEGELRFPIKRRYLFERNMLRTLLKNYSVRNLLLILPRYFSLLLIESLAALLLSGAPLFLNVYVKAISWNVRNLKDTWLMRNKVQQTRKVGDDVIQKNMAKTSYRILIFKELTRNGIPKIRLQ